MPDHQASRTARHIIEKPSQFLDCSPRNSSQQLVFYGHKNSLRDVQQMNYFSTQFLRQKKVRINYANGNVSENFVFGDERQTRPCVEISQIFGRFQLKTRDKFILEHLKAFLKEISRFIFKGYERIKMFGSST